MEWCKQGRLANTRTSTQASDQPASKPMNSPTNQTTYNTVAGSSIRAASDLEEEKPIAATGSLTPTSSQSNYSSTQAANQTTAAHSNDEIS